MFKKTITLLFLIIVSFTAYSQISISTVVSSSLNFGSFATWGNGGTVVVAPNASGTRSKTGDVMLISIPATSSALAYTISRGGSAKFKHNNVQISMPPSVLLTYGSYTMTLNTFTYSSGTGSTFQLAPNQSVTIYIGGTLNVGTSLIKATYASSSFLCTFILE